MGFLSQLRYRLQGWMYGRNGVDQLSRDLNIIGLVIMLSGSLFDSHIVYWIGFIFFLAAFYRIFSRNLAKRSAENRAYLIMRSRLINWFVSKRQLLSSMRYYHFYKCSACKQKLRVPRGKGKIEITCPKCGNHFIKRT